jgi:hypothetical protein
MREVWATYSVRDHLAEKAFIADVMLYDKLVIPVPAADDMERWSANWNPERQEMLIKILGSRAVQVVWDADWRAKWQQKLNAAETVSGMTSVEAMRLTPNALMEKVPKTATGVIAVAPYDSAKELRDSVGVKSNQPGAAAFWQR